MAHWYPCEHPERPNDAHMRWHLRCHGCKVAAEASRKRWPDDLHVALVADLCESPPP